MVKNGEGLVEGVEFTNAAVEDAVKSISGVAGDVGELVAKGLSNEVGGGEGTVSKGDGLVGRLMGVFAAEGFDEGPVFGGRDWTLDVETSFTINTSSAPSAHFTPITP